jgi:hypothetical protein
MDGGSLVDLERVAPFVGVEFRLDRRQSGDACLGGMRNGGRGFSQLLYPRGPLV